MTSKYENVEATCREKPARAARREDRQSPGDPFAETIKSFETSAKDFMINYSVADLEALVEELKKEGETIIDKTERDGYGKIVHIIDAEENKIQLSNLKFRNMKKQRQRL